MVAALDARERGMLGWASTAFAEHDPMMQPVTERVRRPSTFLLCRAWASPATAVGLCVAAAACAGGATVRTVDGVIEVAGGGFGRAIGRFPAPLRFCAITLGHVVLGVDHAALHACRTHEHAHVRQYERWGVLFFPLYAASSLWAAVRGKRPYQDNHFEQQARTVAQRLASPVANEVGP